MYLFATFPQGYEFKRSELCPGVCIFFILGILGNYGAYSSQPPLNDCLN